MSVNSKMTALADEIRELSGTTEAIGLDAMKIHISEANNEVDSQVELLAQAVAALEGKAAGGGATFPTLDNPASASDILSGKESISSSGNIITGNIETFDGSYECSGESTGGGMSVEAWTGTITSWHFGKEFTIHYTDDSLNHCTATVIGSEKNATITIVAGTLIYVVGADDALGDTFVRPIKDNYALLLPTADNFKILVD
jgi:hypothetical protein